MATQRQILRLLKKIENRLCADCDCALGGGKVYASLTFGVWMCPSCHEVHMNSLQIGEKIKCSQDSEWTTDDINLMVAAENNLKQNLTFERYLIIGWPKISSLSSFRQKSLWIRAKYEAKLFSFPVSLHPGDEIAFTNSDDIAANQSEEILPIRIAEMMLIVGPSAGVTMASQNAERTIAIENLSELALSPVVLSCVRADDSVGRTPALVGHVVFPLGIHLSSDEKHPVAFSFVLTNESRIRMYGATLQFYELLEQDELELLVGASLAQRLSSQYPVLYCPKALTLLSYYPFFHLFHETLLSFYHVSLSNAPFPLERLVFNFLKEVPLPPEGVVQVVYPLPDRVLQISRPPTNKLSMVDYSFLPLFLSLSIDNIIIVYRCLCAELSVCVLSSHLSLLTPTQEALLSLLFPMQWQGCYIPVMPLHMTDILEAPVPILVGMHSDYLQRIPERQRPARVVFVNLDNDRIVVGGSSRVLGPETDTVSVDNFGCVEQVSIPCIPKHVLVKLRNRLDEIGGNFPINCRSELLNCDLAYAKNEHMTPLKKYYDASVEISTSAGRDMHTATASWCCTQIISCQQPLSSSLSSSSLLSSSSSSTVASSNLNASSNVSRPVSGISTTPISATLRSRLGKASLLDPATNNFIDGSFQTTEIRMAFLRVFIKSIGDYREFTVGSNANRRSNSHAIDPAKAGQFDTDAFIAAHQNDFFSHQLIATQMFSKFMQEDVKDHPEKKFYLESVSKKRNRSILSFGKEATPFLDDTSEYFTETCRAPEPSNWGLPMGAHYIYQQFPVLDPTLTGPIRPAPILVHTRQKIRTDDSSIQSLDRLVHKQRGQRYDSASLLTKDQDTEKFEYMQQRLELLIASYNIRNKMMEKFIVAVQALYRRRLCRLAFRRVLDQVARIQRWYKTVCKDSKTHSVQELFRRIRKSIAKAKIVCATRQFVRIRLKAAIKIQSLFRCKRQRRHFKGIVMKITLIQSLCLMRRCKKRYEQQRKRIYRLQKYFRGWIVRRVVAKRLKILIQELLAVILIIWEKAHVSIAYRCSFWNGFNSMQSIGSLLTPRPAVPVAAMNADAVITYVNIGILRWELHRMCKYLSINVSRDIEIWQPLRPQWHCVFLSIHPKFVDNLSSLLKTADVSVIVSKSLGDEEIERKELYLAMKKQCAQPVLNELYTLFPNIIGKKKRKRTLSSLVWKFDDSLSLADLSARVISTVNVASFSIRQKALEIVPAIKVGIIQSACTTAAMAILNASHKRRNYAK